jgi:hypothetical protein
LSDTIKFIMVTLIINAEDSLTNLTVTNFQRFCKALSNTSFAFILKNLQDNSDLVILRKIYLHE